MTQNPSNIPERWLDLLTGYVGIGLLFCAMVVGVACLLR